MLEVEVSQFGPIERGRVELKPLTVFVGPNNSGKSYFSILLYALLRSIIYPANHVYRYQGGFRIVRRFWGVGEFVTPDILETKEFVNALKESLNPYLEDARKGNQVSVPITDFPSKITEGLLQTTREYGDYVTSHLAQEIRRCWAVDLHELARKTSTGPKRRTFRICFQQSDPSLMVEIKNDSEKLNVTKFEVEPSLLHLTLDRALALRLRREPDTWLYEVVDDLLRQAFKTSLFVPYYLPAARSGILQNHKALASSAVGRAAMVGIREFPEIPLFPGVVADFISNIIELEKSRPGRLKEVATLLESDVMRGTVDIEEHKEYPELHYDSKVGKFELHRTSSMISELAPVALFLKYVVNPGNLVIIEEPESHLHPDNQRRMARVIARMVRSNVNVLLTTHSDFFTAQLNNFIRLAKSSEDERKQRNYASDDYLRPEEVAAYLFDLDEQQEGTVIRRLPVTDELGISADEFAKVNESLYNETVGLDRIASR